MTSKPALPGNNSATDCTINIRDGRLTNLSISGIPPFATPITRTVTLCKKMSIEAEAYAFPVVGMDPSWLSIEHGHSGITLRKMQLRKMWF